MIKRPRRLRKTEILRKMVRETRIDQASLIYPMFVRDGEGIREEIPSMAGPYRYSVEVKRCGSRGGHALWDSGS